MSLQIVFTEAIKGSISGVLQIAIIVIPLMLFIEILLDLNLLDKLTSLLTPLTRLFGMSKDTCLPLIAGLVFGISYGGGIIIKTAQEGKLSYRDIYLVNLFLVICHSLFEDTLLFAAIGARWIPVLIVRVILAVLICYVFACFTSGGEMEKKGLVNMKGIG